MTKEQLWMKSKTPRKPATIAGLEKLVDSQTLLEVLFDEASRPSLRWLADQCKRRTIPTIKLGHLVHFRPSDVVASLDSRNTRRAREIRPALHQGQAQEVV